MTNEKAIANLVALMTSFYLEIKALPDDLKCAKCKSVLKNACQMPCDCRFCRACIDDLISRGNQFCPGNSQECGGTPLSTAAPDYKVNKSVLKLTAKCPHAGCLHECPLADMESHMRACSSKNIDCPFRELGCAHDALPGDEMGSHLQQESRSHSEILIGTVVNITRGMEMLKRELLLKDEHMENEMKSIIDENKSIKDEIKSIKIENESIKREKGVLSDRLRQLSEKLEQDSAMVIAATAAVASIRDEMNPIRDDIRSIRNQFNYMKRRMESLQVAVGPEQLDDWLIEEDVAKTGWGAWSWWDNTKTSGKFGGGERANTFELASINSVSKGELGISLRVWAGPRASLLEWPFRGVVTVIVAHRDRREACSMQVRQCQIDRPADNRYNTSTVFEFPHVALRVAGVNPERGVRVSCKIVTETGQ